jgi:hypothetical protein
MSKPQPNSIPASQIAWIVCVALIVLCFLIPGVTGVLSNLLSFGILASLAIALILMNVEKAAKNSQLESSIKKNVLQKFAQLKTQFNENIAGEILEELRKVSPTFDSQFFYNSALDLIISHSGDTSVKVFALNIGRWHYSLKREDRKPTIYDEQAIQNDINTRSI